MANFYIFFFLNQNLVKKNVVFKNRLSHSGRCVYMMYFFPIRKLLEFSIQRYVIPVIRAHSINRLRSYRKKEIERENYCISILQEENTCCNTCKDIENPSDDIPQYSED